MGIGWHSAPRLDNMLLLYMERDQSDWQSRLLYGRIPLRLVDNTSHQGCNAARCRGGHPLLYPTGPLKAIRLQRQFNFQTLVV